MRSKKLSTRTYIITLKGKLLPPKANTLLEQNRTRRRGTVTIRQEESRGIVKREQSFVGWTSVTFSELPFLTIPAGEIRDAGEK